MAASSARTLSDLESCNRAMGRVCGAYRVVCDRWWDFKGSINTRTIGTLKVADIRLSNGRVIKDRKRDEYYPGDRYFFCSEYGFDDLRVALVHGGASVEQFAHRKSLTI